MPEVYFQNLSAAICRHISRAECRIQIAVCWFSHREIFDLLLKKLRAGIAVELLLEYDSQNMRSQGLDFHKFIRLGGSLYAYRDTALMHHKFAVLDDRLLLTGSFNWTYNTNVENLLVTDDPGVVSAFRQEFSRLKGLCVYVRKIRLAEVKVFAAFPLFQNTHFQLNDLRRRITSGARVWWVRTVRRPDAWAVHFQAHRIPIDSTGLLRPYWTAYRLWDTALFDEMWTECTIGAKPAAARGLRALARRMDVGDLVVAVVGKNSVLGLGIVQSDPKVSPADASVSFRDVQWLRTFPENVLPLQEDVSPGLAGKFRGSALQLVQEIFSHPA